jgi:hypothetical protein
MSGVSITEGGSGLDVAAVLAGGPEFMARLQAWKDAKDAHDAALADLNLGKGARAALDEASRTLDAAKAQAEAIQAEALDKATKTQKQLNEFVAQVQGEQTRAMESAQSKEREASQKLAAADENHAASVKALNEANDKLAKANAAQDAVSKAQQALSAAL